jgi:hypothetical protein
LALPDGEVVVNLSGNYGFLPVSTKSLAETIPESDPQQTSYQF